MCPPLGHALISFDAFAPRVLVLLAALCGATVAVPASLFDSPHTPKLKREEFTQIISDRAVHVVEFYSEGCRQCQRFAADWKALGEAFSEREDVRLAQVRGAVIVAADSRL